MTPEIADSDTDGDVRETASLELGGKRARGKGYRASGVRRNLGRSACLFVTCFALLLAARILFTPVETVYTWEIHVESAPGLPPVEIYRGEARLGMTPLTIFPGTPDRIFVESNHQDLAIKPFARDALGVIGERTHSPVQYPPPGDVSCAEYFFGSGAWGLLGADIDRKMSARYWSLVACRPDREIDAALPILISDPKSERSERLVLRARRGSASAFGTKVEFPTQGPHEPQKLRRFFLRREEFMVGSLTLIIGPAADRASIEKGLGGDRWYLDRFPAGAPRLESPSRAQPKETTR